MRLRPDNQLEDASAPGTLQICYDALISNNTAHASVEEVYLNVFTTGPVQHQWLVGQEQGSNPGVRYPADAGVERTVGLSVLP